MDDSSDSRAKSNGETRHEWLARMERWLGEDRLAIAQGRYGRAKKLLGVRHTPEGTVLCEPQPEERCAQIPQAEPRLRHPTPEQKFLTTCGLYWSARIAKAAWVRKIHPDWSEIRVNEYVKRLFADAIR